MDLLPFPSLLGGSCFLPIPHRDARARQIPWIQGDWGGGSILGCWRMGDTSEVPPRCVVVVGLCGAFCKCWCFSEPGRMESPALFPVPAILMEMGKVECEVHEQSKRDLF